MFNDLTEVVTGDVTKVGNLKNKTNENTKQSQTHPRGGCAAGCGEKRDGWEVDKKGEGVKGDKASSSTIKPQDVKHGTGNTVTSTVITTVADGHQTCRTRHSVRYTNVRSLCCAPDASVTLQVDYNLKIN